MIMNRDLQIIHTLESFKCATTSQIHELLFKGISIRNCQHRLEDCIGFKYIKRDRSAIRNGYMYYTDKYPSQQLHDYLRLKFYIEASKIYKIEEWKNEYVIGNLRADSYIDMPEYRLFLEIHLSNEFAQEKYELLYKSEMWKQKGWRNFPRIIVVTNQRIKLESTELCFKFIPHSMAGIDKILM